MDLIATVRREIKVAAGPQRDLRLTTLESLATAELEPLCFEASRAGRRFFFGYSAAPTGIAPVQALPTTAAQWTLFNGENPGGKCYAIEQLGEYLTSGTPGAGAVLLGCFFTLPASSGASQAGIAIQNASSSSIGSKAIVKSGVTITTPAAPVWFPIAQSDSPNVAAFPGSANLSNRDLQGRLVLPPQTGLGLAVLAPAGTSPLFAPWAVWCELDTDLA